MGAHLLSDADRRVLCNWVNSAGMLDPDEQKARELRSLLSPIAGPGGTPA